MKRILRSIFGAVIATTLAIFLLCDLASACSRVLWSDSGKAVVVGRTMDWSEDIKTNLWLLPRGIVREGAPGKNKLRWSAKYGSVIATAYDMGTADGVNEKGLTANVLWLDEADYGKRDESVPGLPLSLWAQYMLDNFATVAEAVEFTRSETFQLIEASFPEMNLKVTVHLSLADASGDSAIIEYLGGKPIIYHNRKYTVMTNSPTFDKQLSNLGRYKGFGGDRDLPGSGEATDRFVRAAYYVSNLPKPADDRENVAFILSVIRNVSAPFIVKQDAEGRPNISPTRWRTVADLTNRVYYFESTTGLNIFRVRLNRLNIKPGAPVRKLNLLRERNLVGDVSGKFKRAKPFVFVGADSQ